MKKGNLRLDEKQTLVEALVGKYDDKEITMIQYLRDNGVTVNPEEHWNCEKLVKFSPDDVFVEIHKDAIDGDGYCARGYYRNKFDVLLDHIVDKFGRYIIRLACAEENQEKLKVLLNRYNPENVRLDTGYLFAGELSIGSIDSVEDDNGKWVGVKCVKNPSYCQYCTDCYFEHLDCDDIKCSEKDRYDKNNVHYVKGKKNKNGFYDWED